jgi:hypothetical protein
VLECFARYPTTTSVVIVTAALVWFGSKVPILGWLLMPVVSAAGRALASSTDTSSASSQNYYTAQEVAMRAYKQNAVRRTRSRGRVSKSIRFTP